MVEVGEGEVARVILMVEVGGGEVARVILMVKVGGGEVARVILMVKVGEGEVARVILREGVQGTFFWRIRFELWAPQVPLIIGETFGEVLGPRRPTVSEPRPAQKLGVK